MPIIMISGCADIPMAVQAMSAGAMDFLEKPFSRQTLLARIQEAIDRDAKQRQQAARSAELAARVEKLSARQREVLDLLVAGKHSKQIAGELDIGEKTVAKHRACVLEKMQVDSVVELVRLMAEASRVDVDAAAHACSHVKCRSMADITAAAGNRDQRAGRRAAPPKLKTVVARKLSDYPHLPAAYRDVARRLGQPPADGPADVRRIDRLGAAPVHRGGGRRGAASWACISRPQRRRPGPGRAPAAGADRADPRPPGSDRESGSSPRSGARTDRSPLSAAADRARHLRDDADQPHARVAHRLAPPLRRAVRGPVRDGLLAGLPGASRRRSVRYLPVGKAIEAHPMALPTDKLEVVLDQFEVFGVGQCQCRMAMQVLGQGCGKPLGNCMVMGQWAERGIEEGVLRQVSKKEALEIKREAESHGLVNWMMNVESARGQCSCSCCGCCCHALRMVNEFNAPGFIAPPHFLPRLDAVEMHLLRQVRQELPDGGDSSSIRSRKRYRHLRERCIGCGLCVLACDRQHALAMEPVPDYRLPYRSWFSLIAHATPGVLMTSLEALAAAAIKRKAEISPSPFGRGAGGEGLVAAITSIAGAMATRAWPCSGFPGVRKAKDQKESGVFIIASHFLASILDSAGCHCWLVQQCRLERVNASRLATQPAGCVWLAGGDSVGVGRPSNIEHSTSSSPPPS